MDGSRAGTTVPDSFTGSVIVGGLSANVLLPEEKAETHVPCDISGDGKVNMKDWASV